LEESFTMAIRDEDWKYIEPVSKETPKWLANKREETGLQPTPQLYNLKEDPQERHNLISQHPDIARELAKKLKEIKQKKE